VKPNLKRWKCDRRRTFGRLESAWRNGCGDRFKLAAPRGVLKPAVLAAIRAHKPELLALLARDATAPEVLAGSSTFRIYEYDPDAALRRFLAERSELNNPADVPALLEYFGELPLLPSHRAVYADELRAKPRPESY
jgi:hypothetical protein